MKLNRILLDPLPPNTPIGGGGQPTPPKPAAAAPAPAPSPEPSDDPFESPAAAAIESPKPDAKPAAAAPAAPVDYEKLAPKELRERVKQLNTENQKFNTTIKSLEEKIKELDGKGVDTTALTGRLTQLEKERDSALADLRAARQEASPEFKEKYDKPFNQAAERAKSQISELSVTANAETGETRPATWSDFVALYQLPVGKAIEQAEAMFGKSDQFVLGLREKLLDLDTTRATALEEERAQYKQRSEKEIAESASFNEKVRTTWLDTNKRLAEANPDYKDDPEDSEASEARKHALEVFDKSIPNTNREEFLQKKITKDAHIRQRVGAYPVLKLKLTSAQEKIAALEAQVAELKGTEPGHVQRPGGGEPAGEGDEDWAAGALKAVSKGG